MLPRGTSRMMVVTVFTGRAISTTASHSMVDPVRRNVATSDPAAFSCPPAHTKPVAVRRMASPDSSAVVRDASSPYVFSSLKTRNPNRRPPNATAGSGKSKLNFMNARPRGGTNTSLVEVSGTTSTGTAGGPALGEGSAAMALVPGIAPATTPAAPATPTNLSHSRRDSSPSVARAASSETSRALPGSAPAAFGRRSRPPDSSSVISVPGFGAVPHASGYGHELQGLDADYADYADLSEPREDLAARRRRSDFSWERPR